VETGFPKDHAQTKRRDHDAIPSHHDLKEEIPMANERNPNDPYRTNDPYRPNDPYRSNLTDDEVRRQSRLDNELQPDPELAEGPASGGKVAMFALAIAILLGAVFYGLNNTSVKQDGTSTAQNSSQTSPSAAPRVNTNPGTTTGSAPAQPPATAPAEMNRPSNPPASK
jgi:hypothetical protein